MPAGRRRLVPVPESPPRALGLIRVSKERVDMVSPELQRTAICDYAARRGYRVQRWLEGLDESGSRARSGWWAKLDEAVTLVEGGQVDVLLVWKFSRAARHRLRWATAVDRVEVAGGRLESATEQVDVTTSTGRFTRGMLAELNAFEAERIGEQWKEAQAHRRSLGLPHTGGARFGYVYDKRAGYAPDPVTGPILAGLYARYVAGEGFQQLTIGLNRGRVPTMRGGPWTAQTVLRQLDSGFAAGMLRVHEPACSCRRPSQCRRHVLVRGAHEPLIDESTWRAYLARREQMRRMPARHRRARHALSGVLRCGECGGAMSAYDNPNRRGERVVMWRCTVWQSARTCRGVWISNSSAESQLLGWLGAQARDVEVRAVSRVARQAAAAASRADRARLAREVGRLDRTLATASRQLAEELLPAASYAALRDELLAERAVLEAQLAELAEDELALSEGFVPVVRGLLSEWGSLPVSLRRDMLRSLVRRVEAHRVDGRRARLVVVPRWG